MFIDTLFQANFKDRYVFHDLENIDLFKKYRQEVYQDYEHNFVGVFSSVV